MATKKTAVKSPHSLDRARKLKESISKDFDTYKRINQDLQVAEWVLAGRPDLEKALGFSGDQKRPIGYNIGIILMDRVIRLLDEDTEENNQKIANAFGFLSECPAEIQYAVVKGTISMEVITYRKHILKIPNVMKVYTSIRRAIRQEQGFFIPKELAPDDMEKQAFKSLAENGPDGLESSHVKAIYDWVNRYVEARPSIVDADE
jgi:hypothetical protein